MVSSQQDATKLAEKAAAEQARKERRKQQQKLYRESVRARRENYKAPDYVNKFVEYDRIAFSKDPHSYDYRFAVVLPGRTKSGMLRCELVHVDTVELVNHPSESSYQLIPQWDRRTGQVGHINKQGRLCGTSAENFSTPQRYDVFTRYEHNRYY